MRFTVRLHTRWLHMRQSATVTGMTTSGAAARVRGMAGAMCVLLTGCGSQYDAAEPEAESQRHLAPRDAMADYTPSKEEVEAVTNLVSAIREVRERYGTPMDWALNAARTNSEPKQLRAWALEELAESSNRGVDACAAITDLPECVKQLHPWGGVPTVLVYTASPIPPAKCVQLIWGGGFGKYGLLIGDEQFRPPTNWVTKEWVPGIFGWQTSE